MFFLFVFLCTKEARPGDAGQTIRAPGEYVFKLLINAQKQVKSCSMRMRVRKQMGKTRNVLMEKLKKTKQKRILVFLFYTDVNRGNHLSQRRLSSIFACCGSFSNVLQNNSTYGHNPFSGGEGVTESMPLTV